MSIGIQALAATAEPLSLHLLRGEMRVLQRRLEAVAPEVRGKQGSVVLRRQMKNCLKDSIVVSDAVQR